MIILRKLLKPIYILHWVFYKVYEREGEGAALTSAIGIPVLLVFLNIMSFLTLSGRLDSVRSSLILDQPDKATWNMEAFLHFAPYILVPMAIIYLFMFFKYDWKALFDSFEQEFRNKRSHIIGVVSYVVFSITLFAIALNFL